MQKPFIMHRTDRLKEQLEGRLPYWRPSDGTGNFVGCYIRKDHIPINGAALEWEFPGYTLRVARGVNGEGLAVFGSESEELGWLQFFVLFKENQSAFDSSSIIGELVAVSYGTREIPFYAVEVDGKPTVALRLETLEQPLVVELDYSHPLWSTFRAFTHITGNLK